MTIRRILTVFAAWAMVALGASGVQAQQFPNRPITMVIGFTAGGGADAVGRKLAELMSANLGQQVIVENKPGAATKIAAEYVKSAPADGYTLLYASNSTLALVPAAYKNAQFSAADFAPVAGVIDTSVAVVARKDAPFDDMKGLVNYAKANPDKVTFGTAGRGGALHMLQMLINVRLGLKTKDVPYQGGAKALQDILGGRLDVYADAIQAVAQHHDARTVKVLAVSGSKRVSMLANVPTFAEQGFDNLTTDFWWDVVVPKGTPEAVIARLNAAIKVALEDRGFRDWLAASGSHPAYSSPAEEASKITNGVRAWGEMVKEFKISLE